MPGRAGTSFLPTGAGTETGENETTMLNCLSQSDNRSKRATCGVMVQWFAEEEKDQKKANGVSSTTGGELGKSLTRGHGGETRRIRREERVIKQRPMQGVS